MPLPKEETGLVPASTIVLFLLLKVILKLILLRYYSRICACLPVGVCTICILVCAGTCSLPTNQRQRNPEAIKWPNTKTETNICMCLVWES